MTDRSESPLDRLGDRLRAAQEREAAAAGRPKDVRGGVSGTGMGLGFRVAVELVAGVAVGGLIGYALGGWLGFRPLLMMAFLLLGGAGGVMNAYRAAKGLDQTVGMGESERRARERNGQGRPSDMNDEM